jgi:predicted nucleic acid-binding Zn ribbon protein
MVSYRVFAFMSRSRPNEKSVCTKQSRDYNPAMKALVCPHCQTPVSDVARVCRGCGAEIVRGTSRRERSLTGVIFVIVTMLIAVVLFRALEVVCGAPALSSPRAEDGFLVFLGLVAVVVVPYIMGTRVARLLRRSRIRFYRTYQHQ